MIRELALNAAVGMKRIFYYYYYDIGPRPTDVHICILGDPCPANVNSWLK